MVTLGSTRYTGDFTKKIAVTTNDPANRSQVLTCKGRVQVPVNMNPRLVNFGQMPRNGAVQSRKVVFTRGDAGPLSLTLKPTAAEAVQAVLTEVTPGERYELEVKVRPPFKGDRLRTNVVLETGLAEVPTVHLPVVAAVAPRVAAIPRAVIVPAARTDKYERPILLAWDDSAPHRILGATIDDAELSVRVEEVNKKPAVVLRVPPAYQQKSRMRTITIRTDDEQMPEVRVPVTFGRARRPSRAAVARRAAAQGKKLPSTKAAPAKLK